MVKQMMVKQRQIVKGTVIYEKDHKNIIIIWTRKRQLFGQEKDNYYLKTLNRGFKKKSIIRPRPLIGKEKPGRTKY